jgi:hypothetical protein
MVCSSAWKFERSDFRAGVPASGNGSGEPSRFGCVHVDTRTAAAVKSAIAAFVGGAPAQSRLHITRQAKNRR